MTAAESYSKVKQVSSDDNAPILVRKGGFEAVIGILMQMGAMCPDCAFGTRVKNRKWNECKKCGKLIARTDVPKKKGAK